MIDASSINQFAKEFNKETNEIKYLVAIFNDIKTSQNFMKSSIESETKIFENFNKMLINTSKSFMNDISCLNYTENSKDIVCKNIPVIVNISMSLGNQFENMGKIFYEELENFTSKLNSNFADSHDHSNTLQRYLLENLTLSFKEISTGRNKYKSAIQKCEKLFRDLENYTKKKSEDEKPSEKICSIFIELNEANTQLSLIFEEMKKNESLTEEGLNNFFINIYKFTFDSIQIFRENFKIITNFKALVINKIWKSLSLINETISSLEIDNNTIQDFSTNENDLKYEIKNLPEISERFSNYISVQTMSLSFKKRIFLTFSKFLLDYNKLQDNIITNFQKNLKNLYNISKSDKNFSYLNGTSVVQLNDYLKSVHDLNVKKLSEVHKFISTNIQSAIDTLCKEISNDENILAQSHQKFLKDYNNYKVSLNKFLINKEKIINQIVNFKESLKPEDYAKYENKINQYKTEEYNLNESINEMNNKYKNLLEDSVLTLKMNIMNGIKEKNYGDSFRWTIISLFSQMEKTYSQLNDYIYFKNDIQSKHQEADSLKKDLKNIFEVFIKEYFLIQDADSFISHLMLKIKSAETEYLNEYSNNIIEESSLVVENKSFNGFSLMNKEDSILELKDFLFETEKIFRTEDFSFFKDKANNSTKSKSSRKVSLEERILIGENEKIIDFYLCCYYDKSIFSIGKIYLTQKKIIFESRNNYSNKTLLEVNKYDLLSVTKVESFDDMIKIKSKINRGLKFIFLFSSEKNLEKLLNNIKSTFKVDELSNIQVSSEGDSDVLTMEPVEIKIEELKENINIPTDLNTQMDLNSGIEVQNNLTLQDLEEIGFCEKLKEFNKTRITNYYSNNFLRKNFNASFIKDQILGKNVEIPIFLVYKYIYDHEQVCKSKELNYNKNFILSLKEINKDYNINFNYMKLNSDEIKTAIPKFFQEPYEYSLRLTTKPEKKDLECFLQDLEKDFNDNHSLFFQYKYTHPMKKKFMGPSKLDMNDEYKICFVSPLCFVVEITTYLAGFMLMDTFYTVAQYKYEAEPEFDVGENRIKFNTKVTASFAIEFVKDNWFRNKIESNGMVDNEIHIKEFVLANIRKYLTEISTDFKRKASNHNKLNKNNTFNNNDLKEISSECVDGEKIENEILNNRQLVIEEFNSNSNSNNNLHGENEEILISKNFTEKLREFIRHILNITNHNSNFSTIYSTSFMIVVLVILYTFLGKDFVFLSLLVFNIILCLKISKKVEDLEKRLNIESKIQ